MIVRPDRDFIQKHQVIGRVNGEINPTAYTLSRSVDLAEALRRKPDCAVICTDHSVFDYAAIAGSGVLVVDTRNALKAFDAPTIFRL